MKCQTLPSYFAHRRAMILKGKSEPFQAVGGFTNVRKHGVFDKRELSSDLCWAECEHMVWLAHAFTKPV